MPESSSSSGAPPAPAPLHCPRCDSANTKFCYYNNYSLSQPRHFCKSCRRYWTKGGSLRNIPIGGGCRKPTKKPPSFASPDAALALRLFHGLTPSSSSMAPDHFQGLSLNPFPFTTTTTTTSGPCNQPMPGLSSFNQLMEGGHGDSVVATPSQNADMASSIESLSAQNLELHWKLQQQRMSLLYGGDGAATDSIINDKPTTTTTNGCSQYLMEQRRDQHQNPTNNNCQKELLGHVADGGGTTSFVGVGPDVAALEKPQPMYFHNLEAAVEAVVTDDIINPNSMPNDVVHPACDNNGAGNEAAAEWFLDTGDSNGGKDEESNVNARNINAGNCLNDDGTCGAQGWTDADESHHFNGLV